MVWSGPFNDTAPGLLTAAVTVRVTGQIKGRGDTDHHAVSQSVLFCAMQRYTVLCSALSCCQAVFNTHSSFIRSLI